jgi:UDP-N-acetylmuramyl pentapeptide phosphotransferase/UDP-N-acetylglucosamine-1-phosphate transferase
MADGANGLIPGIIFATFFVFSSEAGRMFEVGYMGACFIFLVFNLIFGRFFLGDMGSYGLGAAVALYGLWFVSEGVFSASFLACLPLPGFVDEYLSASECGSVSCLSRQ